MKKYPDIETNIDFQQCSHTGFLDKSAYNYCIILRDETQKNFFLNMDKNKEKICKYYAPGKQNPSDLYI